MDARMRWKFSTCAARPEALRPECWMEDSAKISGNALASWAFTAATYLSRSAEPTDLEQ